MGEGIAAVRSVRVLLGKSLQLESASEAYTGSLL